MPASTRILRITGLYATRLLKKGTGSTVTEIQATLTNGVDFKTDIKDLTFEGDGQEVTKYNLKAINAETTADNFDLAAITNIFGLSTVTTGLPADSVERAYFGTLADSGGIKCGLACYCTAEGVATGANLKVRITIPLGTLSAMNVPALKSLDKSQMKLSFSGERTSVDIAGAALPGVPSGGAFWFYDVLA